MTEFTKPALAGTAELCLPPHLRKPRLRRSEASEYLALAHGLSFKVSTLAKLIVTGGGPAVQYCNRSPLYPREELDRWAAEKIGPLCGSSSEREVTP
ncbi:hypothetical protein AncyloWKF20_09485 [Ancylobacter sp. WKF20]|uniref:hypothetical protein n=1 Tax=Ancylobacter sp. WKF20 TaxID=3039801 RepID=UPI00243448A8|nr:hypothetical protein [Ancylobacter sp. WKF20]WGD32024.1 hypothetical protein AncyloWKF20_09485 [Ancylobacter sp. WKF20]